MNVRFLLAALAFAAGAPALANNYPTTDRVEFVLECMRSNGGEYQYLYKCSCMIDEIANQLSYDKYVEAATVARYAAMGGERNGIFRDPDNLKQMARGYRETVAAARKSCGVAR